MTFHTLEQVRELHQPLTIEFLNEEKGEKPTALQGLRFRVRGQKALSIASEAM